MWVSNPNTTPMIHEESARGPETNVCLDNQKTFVRILEL